MIVGQPNAVTMRIETNPEECAKHHALMERFQKNADWLQAHIPEVYSKHRGKVICVAGRELFVADTAEEVLAMARKAHPEDDAPLLRYIYLEKMERIYAC
jgi:hypothetical protein